MLHFDWSNEDDVRKVCGEDFDVVLGADCVFSLRAVASLCDCLDTVMEDKNTTGYMSVETRDDAVTEAFVETMKKKDFRIAMVSLEGIDDKYLHEDLAIYKFSKPTKRLKKTEK